jgi:RNA polymerase sigma-70 factor (ECF subfamily)
MSEGHPDVHLLADHLFRRESGKMVSALTRVFGTHNLGLAEDVVQEALVQALRQWPFAGIPRSPAGWLYQVAKNKAIDAVRREQAHTGPAPAARDGLPPARVVEPLLDEAFVDEEIKDDTLRMMFTCCHPALPLESQIALTLKILCGFSSAEIARALLTQEPAVQKRLYRAKQRLREEHIAFEVPSGPELASRLRAVLSVLYLMFNEGYSASFAELPIRRDVCVEAMRLCKLLTEHPAGQHPGAFALMALMCFHAARFDARLDDGGHLLMLKSQDRSQWDRTLLAEGFRYLDRSARGDEIDEIQLEAGIAATHCSAESYEQTNWGLIVHLYDLLLAIKPSPVVALNRAIALAEVQGTRAALDALAAIREHEVLETYPFYPATLGELHLRLGDVDEAAHHLARAIALTSSPAEKRFLQEKLNACCSGQSARSTEIPSGDN